MSGTRKIAMAVALLLFTANALNLALDMNWSNLNGPRELLRRFVNLGLVEVIIVALWVLTRFTTLVATGLLVWALKPSWWSWLWQQAKAGWGWLKHLFSSPPPAAPPPENNPP
jgi:hypothetical protein